MKISNGLKIATSNKALSYKLLLYKFIVAVLGCVSIYFFASIIIKPVLESEQLKNLIDIVRRIIVEYFNVGSVQANNLNDKLALTLQDLHAFIIGMKGNIISSLIFVFIIVQIMKFLFAVCDYVIAVNINEHMSSMRHAEFFSTLFENFKKACYYALYRTVMLLVYNVVIISISIAGAMLLLKWLGISSLTIILLLVFGSIALRLSIVGHVLPKMVCENKSPFRAFIEGFKEKSFSVFIERFISYFVMVLCIYAVAFLTAIITYNVALLVTVPFASVLLITVRFVDYYACNHKKYYVTFDEIVIPKELRQNDENLLNKVDI